MWLIPLECATYINNCLFTFVSELWHNALPLKFWCIKCTNPKGDYIGQTSNWSKFAIFCHNSWAQSKNGVLNLIHTWHKQTLAFFCDKYNIMDYGKYA